MSKIILRTGVGGFDLFDEAFEKQLGYKRIKIGKKVPRILRKIKEIIIKKSVKGEYYKLIKPKEKLYPGLFNQIKPESKPNITKELILSNIKKYRDSMR